MKTLLAVFILTCGFFGVLAQTQTNPPVGTNATNSVLQTPAISNAPANTNGGLLTPPNNAPVTDWSKYVAIVVSILALGYTILKDTRTNKRMAKIEKEQEREKHEAANRRAKASAPYLTPLRKMFNMIYETNDDGGMGGWSGMNANVLSITRKELTKDVPEKTPVILPLENSGKRARRVRISGDIPEVELRQEPEMRSANGIIFLKYPYSPSEHGKTQKVILKFETEDGLELTHTYETRHGCFEFHRIDPE